MALADYATVIFSMTFTADDSRYSQGFNAGTSRLRHVATAAHLGRRSIISGSLSTVERMLTPLVTA
jgi:hypothetical protein